MNKNILLQPARADGDPASDVLVTQDVFLPTAAVATDVAVSLQRQVERAYAQGERVKVAVILTPVDLGSIPSLFDKPSA